MRGWTTLGVLLAASALTATLAADDDRPPKHGTFGDPTKVSPKPKPKVDPKTDPKVEPVAGNKLVVVVTDGTLGINGKGLALPFEQQQLVAALGKPDREVKLSSVLVIWDGLGLFAHVKPGSTRVRAVTLALDRDTLSFWPKKNFAGSLTIDGATVTADSSATAINKAKKGQPFVKDGGEPEVWRLEGKTTTLTLGKGSGGKFTELTISLSDE